MYFSAGDTTGGGGSASETRTSYLAVTCEANERAKTRGVKRPLFFLQSTRPGAVRDGGREMYEIKVVVVSVGSIKGYPYREVRVVRKLTQGGHYLRSKGCTVLWKSGWLRGTVRAELEAERIASGYRAQLEREQAESDRVAVSEYLRETPATAEGARSSVSPKAVTAKQGW